MKTSCALADGRLQIGSLQPLEKLWSSPKFTDIKLDEPTTVWKAT